MGILSALARKAIPQRLKDAGYAVPAYRGLNAPYTPRDDVQFFAASPKTAETYLHNLGDANVLPAALRIERPLVVDAKGRRWDDVRLNKRALRDLGLENHTSYPIQAARDNLTDAINAKSFYKDSYFNNPLTEIGTRLQIDAQILGARANLALAELFGRVPAWHTDEIVGAAKNTGKYDGVVFRNIKDGMKTGDSAANQEWLDTTYAVWDPRQIRARWARGADPTSRDLLAGMAIATPVGGGILAHLMAQQEHNQGA